jgi:hypothetical protein
VTTPDGIDVFDRSSEKTTTDAGSRCSHSCQIMSRCSTTLTIPTMTCAEIYELQVWMVSGVWVRKWRYGGCDHFWLFLVSLFSPSLLWISAQYKWHRHRFLPPSESIKWRWILPVRQIPPKVAIELYRSVVGLMGSYDCVCRMIVSFFVSLLFFSLILALAAQEVSA